MFMSMQIKQVGKFNLYYKGTWNDKLFTKCMGVVGSRRITNYGHQVVEKIVPQLVFDGWTIVSGFMYGVDIAAHKTCLECGGKTIAVLGWGINYQNDSHDQKLLDQIVDSDGLVLSLWDDQPGTNWTFPARNKVVAEISHEIIVVEAAIKSGALLTATMVRNLKKPIWAIPGPITSSVSAGTNKLLADGLAKPWLGKSPSSPLTSSANSLQTSILNILQNESLDSSEISRKLQIPINQISAELSVMILTGALSEKNGKYYQP